MGGAVFVLGSDFLRQPTIGWGDTLALFSGICYAGYYLMTERGRRELDTLSYVWAASLSASLVLLAISLATRAPLTGCPWQTYLAFVGAALIPQVTGYLAIGYALGHLPASVVSPTMLGQPVLTALLAIPFLGEALEPVQWVGGLVVLGGIYLVHRGRQVSTGESHPKNNGAPTAQSS
jgi:drug/metabolite transporter (DMT)-like permease